METIELLGRPDLDALRCLLGRPLLQMFTRSIDLYRHVAVARNFSIPLEGGKFCVIESDWNDTVENAIDYHILEVRVCDTPKGFSLVTGRDGALLLGSPSSINLLTGSRVTKIEVLEHRDEFKGEKVHFDLAIVFSTADRYRFALSAQQSIAGGLEFFDQESLVGELLERHSVRVTLD
ncbi:MAG: hypothetical protein AAGA68_00025 [Pseudomonadota bacterium]